MQRGSRSWWYGVGGSVLCCVVLAGCQAAERREDEPGAQRAVATHSRSARVVQDAESLPRLDGPEPTEPVGPAAVSNVDEAVLRRVLEEQIPDPDRRLRELPDLNTRLAEELEKASDQEKEVLRDERRISELELRYLEAVATPGREQVQLTLKDCINKVLENNYAIRTAAYDPAIASTKVVEAEAQFDAVYFLDLSHNKQDRPTSSQLQGTLTEARSFDSGVRKLLSTGTQVSVSYAVSRTYTDLVFQTLNPSWFNQFIIELRQPLFRGFGLDLNRAQIEVSKIDRRISMEQFRRHLQDMLFEVENRYWRLKGARATVGVWARHYANMVFYEETLTKRGTFDVAKADLDEVRAQRNEARVAISEAVAACNTAEKELKAILCDSSLGLPLPETAELIPTDDFATDAVVHDRLGEIQAALDNRPELREAKLQIEKARVGIGVAKNQALPKADVVLQYKVDGLGANWDQTFSQLSEARFHEYYVALQFEWPIGNRGPEAAIRRARLQQSQAVAAYAWEAEKVITEVSVAVGEGLRLFTSLGPQVGVVEHRERVVAATRRRITSKSLTEVRTVLQVTGELARNRNELIRTLMDWTLSPAQVEKTKGTLLKYNNIDIRDPGLSRPVAAAWVPPVEAP